MKSFRGLGGQLREAPIQFFDRHGNEIRSLDDWKRLGKPAAEYHWAEGRGAYELAADWIEGDAAARATALLLKRPELEGLRLTKGIAEKQTRFDEIHGGPRNHDLLVEAECDAGAIVIAVEGKADEPFDLPLLRWREKALKRTATSRAPERLDNLTRMFFGSTIDTDELEPRLGDLGYQLLSALAGTLADAHRCCAASAAVLVHEFKTNRTDDRLHEANALAFDRFLQRLAPDGIECNELSDGWITGPITVRGDGRWLPDTLPVVVAKLVTNRR